jgi:hypothetical protein
MRKSALSLALVALALVAGTRALPTVSQFGFFLFLSREREREWWKVFLSSARAGVEVLVSRWNNTAELSPLSSCSLSL